MSSGEHDIRAILAAYAEELEFRVTAITHQEPALTAFQKSKLKGLARKAACDMRAARNAMQDLDTYFAECADAIDAQMQTNANNGDANGNANGSGTFAATD